MAGTFGNIMSFFGPAQPQQQPNPLAPQGNLPLPQQQAPANPLADPANPLNQANLEKPVASPLDALADIWNIDPKAQASLPASLSEFSFNVKPEDVIARSKQVDFTKAVSPEIMEKIAKGGPEAMAAMLEAMNAMSQQVFANASLVGSRTVEAGIRSSGTHMEKNLPSYVRKETISQALREDNPLFSHPATAPMLEMFETQLSMKYPNATPAEIKSHAKNFLTEFVKVGAGHLQLDLPQTRPVQQGRLANGDHDWSQEPA